MTDTSDLWTCPECSKRFVGRNMWHSCGEHSVEAFLAGKSERALALWEQLVDMVGRCGPFELAAAKTRIGFMVRARFAGITALSDRGMSLGFWLKEEIDSPRFAKKEHLGGRDWIYRIRITDPSQLDDEVQTWLCQAYQVGCQRA